MSTAGAGEVEWFEKKIPVKNYWDVVPEGLWFFNHHSPSEIAWLLRSRAFAKYYRWYQFWFRTYHHQYERSTNPIFVYQIGRCGSTTTWRSLEAVTDAVVLRNHYMTDDPRWDENIKAIEKQHNLKFHLRKWSKVNYIDKVMRANDGKRWKVICTIRDPGTRSMSRFFHSQHGYLRHGREEPLEETLAVLAKRYKKMQDQQVKEMSAWFGNNLTPFTGINILDHPFSTEKGYTIYEGDEHDVLVLRLENIDTTAKDAFREFLGLDNVPIIHSNSTNVAEKGALKPFYNEFKEVIEPDLEYLDRLYSLDWVVHCYSKEEIKKMKAHWVR